MMKKTGLFASLLLTVLLQACVSSGDYMRYSDDRSSSAVKVGDPVFAQWSDGHFYPAQVTSVSGKNCRIYYPDGYDYSVGPGQYMLNRHTYRTGEKVIAMWTNKKWYSGTIGEIQGNRLFILYSDGDKLWVEHGWVVPLDIYNGKMNQQDLVK